MSPWLTSNTGLKVVAVVLAIFVWFFVRAVTSDSRTVEGVPVEIKVPAGLVVVSSSPKTVNVTVRGTTDDLRQASRSELFAVVDLQHEARTGTFKAELSPHDIRHPRRVLVTTVEPANITIHLEKAVE